MQIFNKEKVHKVLSGSSDKQSAKEVSEWFSSSMEGRQCLSDMLDKDAYLLENDLNENESISPFQSEILYSKIRKSISKRKINSAILKIAAVMLPFVVLIGMGFYLNQQVDLFGKSQYTELYIPKGESARIFFQDGTEVYLNSDTKVRYPQKFGLRKRDVYLEGEAYFNVMSNKKRPFVVHTGETSIKVLGTSFNVNAYKDNSEIRVALDEGKIVFATAGNEYKLNPGQKFIFDKENKKLFVENLYDSGDESLWKSNYVRLNDTPLSETLNILNRKFDTPFKVMDAKAFTYSFNLLTENKPLEYILNELEKIAPLKFTEVNDTIAVKYLK